MSKAARVQVLNRQRRVKVDAARVRRVAAQVLADEGIAPALGVEVVLLRDAAIARLNACYRARGGATDVLSFPCECAAWPEEEAPLLGSVVISVDRACEQARAAGVPVANELRRLLVHGLLHLAGYRDDEPRARARMRRRENRHLGRRIR